LQLSNVRFYRIDPQATAPMSYNQSFYSIIQLVSAIEL
jgi:hypothetical protein